MEVANQPCCAAQVSCQRRCTFCSASLGGERRRRRMPPAPSSRILSPDHDYDLFFQNYVQMKVYGSSLAMVLESRRLHYNDKI